MRSARKPVTWPVSIQNMCPETTSTDRFPRPNVAAASSCIFFVHEKEFNMTCTCCQPLSESQRVDYPASLFGAAEFPFRVEPLDRLEPLIPASARTAPREMVGRGTFL